MVAGFGDHLAPGEAQTHQRDDRRRESAMVQAMSRVNDVGGMQGFGPVEVADDGAPFHADWEARVFALNTALLRAGIYNLDEFRDAIERMPPHAYLEVSYYERWFAAIRILLAEKGIATPAELEPRP